MGIKAKKAQFYILTAAILCVVVYGAVSRQTIPTYQEDYKFKETVNNFIIEAPVVINHARYSNHNITQALEDFEEDYRDYLDSLDLSFSVVYIIIEQEKLTIRNIYNSTISITTPISSYALPYNEILKIEKSDWINIDVNGITYNYTLATNEPLDLKLLFVRED
jgi:hypothetical protein